MALAHKSMRIIGPNRAGRAPPNHDGRPAWRARETTGGLAMAKFDAQTLRELRDVQEVMIRTEKHPKSAVVIWVVVADDEVFVRSWPGAKGRWYRDLAAGGPAALEFAGNPGERPSSGRPRWPRIPEEVSAEHPCAGDGALRNLADHLAARTTLRLLRRSAPRNDNHSQRHCERSEAISTAGSGTKCLSGPLLMVDVG